MAAVISENFVIQQGEDFSKDFILTNLDQSLVGVSSYTASAYMAKYAGDTTTYTFTVGITTSTSTINISMANTMTAALDSGRYYYNVFTVDGSSKKVKQREGSIIVNASVLS
jgi:hypothetical protein